MTERTLVIIKPDALEKGIAGEIVKRFEARGFQIAALDRVRLNRRQAEEFYAVHRSQPFYARLVDYMISGPCIPMVLEGTGVIQGVRELIGDTDPASAREGTIRKEFATNVTVNCVHASDGPLSAEKEIAFFFDKRSLVGEIR
jgi:nucleoside-diphosphate kinase